jgi:two-component system sensor histidine kinase BaeS
VGPTADDERPSWWPEGEPFPPDRAERWRRFSERRRERARPLGCIVLAAVTVLVSIAIVTIWLFATLIGLTGVESGLGHLGRGGAAVLLVVILVGLATAVRMGGRVVRPVRELIDAARRIEAGDYGVRVGQARGPREVRELSAAFNTMAARLGAEEANRRRLLADLSHELRTPIAVIEGHLEAVLDGVYPADAAHLDPILDEARILDRLIDDLRTLSLAEAGALALHREGTDLGHVIADVVAALAPRSEAAGAAVVSDVDPALPELDVDPVRLHQVLTNLLENALRYSPAGSEVRVTARRGPRGVEVTVADQGPGLAPEVRATLFDRFAKSKDSPGSGLGLSIAKAIIEAHGGRIRAEAGPGGRGTTVAVSLPVP